MNENMKTYLKSAKQMIANGGACSIDGGRSLDHIRCFTCFYRTTAPCTPLSDLFLHKALAEKRVSDAKAFIARYNIPVHIELEGLE